MNLVASTFFLVGEPLQGLSTTMEKNQQSCLSHSFPLMEKDSPDTENGVRGQSTKR